VISAGSCTARNLEYAGIPPLGFSAMMGGRYYVKKIPWQIATLYSGDWLLKTVLIDVIVGVRRTKHRCPH
jgi:hypothetical protein